MYRILQEEGIDLPRYAVLNRDPDRPEGKGYYLGHNFEDMCVCDAACFRVKLRIVHLKASST